MREPEREDGDDLDDRIVEAAETRQWMMKHVERRAAEGDAICGYLLGLERMASPFFLGTDYDSDLGDVEERE
jgi:hypothetical protein